MNRVSEPLVRSKMAITLELQLCLSTFSRGIERQKEDHQGTNTTLTFRHQVDLFFIAYPGDFRSWESPQTLPALFIGTFEHVEWFRNLKFAVKRITDIQSTVLSSSGGTAAFHLAFK